jgi:predicted metalloprotease with PDZ domain
MRASLIAVLISSALALQSGPLPPVLYQLSFPAPHHRWMQVEVTFPDVAGRTLTVSMSRSSPGRYALHDFGKNVFAVEAYDGAGKKIDAMRRTPHHWDVTGHDGTVRVAYRVYGDRVDGTYLGVDASHAHINMPAALMWAAGFENRPATVRFDAPKGWEVATQLFQTDDRRTYTAPNFQYLMDSPTEVGPVTWRTFAVDEARFRIALHHQGSGQDADRYAADVEAIVRQARAVYGEFPVFEPGSYTFIADYLPSAVGDGMEHRNSTILTSSGSLATDAQRAGMLNTMAHEFFHVWNVERIRPRSLEPFDFSRENISGELWLAEGFTSYYDDLLTARAGLAPLASTIESFASNINTVATSPGRQFRSAVEMSRMAPLVDGARWLDRTNLEHTHISYYTWGAAIGLALDLSLRGRSGGRVTLDDYMRHMWEAYGKPGGRLPGFVDRPYTLDDAREKLGEIAGDPMFARDFFARYIEGREIADYASLLARAGIVLTRRQPGRPWAGDLSLTAAPEGARISSPVPPGSPAYDAGLQQNDLLVSIGGDKIAGAESWEVQLQRRRPGDRLAVRFVRGAGASVESTIVLQEAPHLTLQPVERAGKSLEAHHRAFRDAWLGKKR